MNYTILTILMLCALLAAPAGAAPATVMLADGRTLERVTLKPGPAAEQLTIEHGGGPPLTLAPTELFAADFGKVPGRPPTPSVRLANGDQVYGDVTFPAARQVRIAAGWGSITVPLAWCAAIRLDDRAALPEPGVKDTLVLANDRVQGSIQGVADGKVTIDLGAGPVPLPLSRVQSIALAPRPESARPPADEPGRVRVALDLGGGERLSGRWVGLTPDVLRIRLDWGELLDVPLASLSRLEVKNGRLVYLSALAPAEVRQVPYLDSPSPFQADRSVSGRPMRLSGRTYRRGLGTHSRCELTYSLEGTFSTFSATLGIDDGVGGQGSVVYRVYGDEKLLFESPVARGGDAPIEMKVEVKRVLLLRLEVDFADNGDVADHANWADARLLR